MSNMKEKKINKGMLKVIKLGSSNFESALIEVSPLTTEDYREVLKDGKVVRKAYYGVYGGHIYLKLGDGEKVVSLVLNTKHAPKILKELGEALLAASKYTENNMKIRKDLLAKAKAEGKRLSEFSDIF